MDFPSRAREDCCKRSSGPTQPGYSHAESHRSLRPASSISFVFLSFNFLEFLQTSVRVVGTNSTSSQITSAIAVPALFHGENSNQPSYYIPRYLFTSHSCFLSMSVRTSLTCDVIALQHKYYRPDLSRLKVLGRPEGSIPPSECMVLSSNSCKVRTVPRNHPCLSESTPTKR